LVYTLSDFVRIIKSGPRVRTGNSGNPVGNEKFIKRFGRKTRKEDPWTDERLILKWLVKERRREGGGGCWHRTCSLFGSCQE
jgi:hypothetical protein